MKNKWMNVVALGLVSIMMISCGIFNTQTNEGLKPSLLDPIKFTVISDMPYTDDEVKMLDRDGEIYAAVADFKPQVLLYLGDFKSGKGDCTDALLQQRHALIANIWPNKTVYTPGDNDWTDCDRASMTVPRSELGMLTSIRTLFYQQLRTDNQIKGLRQQPSQPENRRWQLGDVVFATLHVVGSNNGRYEILQDDVNQVLDAVEQRDAANITWIDETFKAAQSASAVVLAFQADIYQPDQPDSEVVCDGQQRTDCDGFRRLRDYIEKRVVEYKKPVLVIHGDTSAVCYGQLADGLVNGLVTNLWRLNAAGDYALPDGINVVFNGKDQKQPFEVKTLMGQESLPSICKGKNDYR